MELKTRVELEVWLDWISVMLNVNWEKKGKRFGLEFGCSSLITKVIAADSEVIKELRILLYENSGPLSNCD